MKQLLTVAFILFLLSANAIPKKPLEIPVKYFNPSGNVWHKILPERVTGTAWEVFTYYNTTDILKKDGTKIKTIRGFLKPFFVAAETEKMIYLVMDSNLKFNGEFSEKAKGIGWVNKVDVLLWSKSLVTVEGISRKAMVLNTVNSLKKQIKGNNKFVFFENPQLNIESSVTPPGLFQIYYVYGERKKDGSVLIGMSPQIYNSQNVEKDISGWVSVNQVTKWDHRVAIEPAWDNGSLRREQQAKALVFSDRIAADEYAKTGKINTAKLIWKSDPFETRNIGDWRRFPFLDTPKDVFGRSANFIKVGVMGEIVSKSGKIDQNKNASYQRKYNEIRESLKRINLLFVIDGTSSMDKYYRPIADAVENSMLKLTSSKYNNEFNFGAVVYRDYAEGNKKVEIKQFTNKFYEVSHFIKNIKAGDQNDKDIPEAVNYGLKTALRQAGWSRNAENETNFVFLIGDAGNHKRNDPTQVSQAMIENLLSEKKCHLFVFQANRKNDSSYQDFIDEFASIVNNVAKKSFNQYRSKIKNVNYSITPPKFIKTKNSYYLTNTSSMGRIIFPDVNKALNPEQIQLEIEKIVEYSNHYINALLKNMDEVIMEGNAINEVQQESSSEYVSSFSPAIYSYLSELGIDNTDLNSFAEKRYQMYTEGYAAIRTKKSNKEPLFNNVLFLTRLELGDLILKMESLAVAISGSNRRDKMKNVWIELLKKHIGGLTQQEIENMTIEQLNQKAFGLPGKSDFIKDVRLKDITDKSIISDSKFQKYVVGIQQKKRKLDGIFNQPHYPYSFKSNDKIYYWIAEEYLP